MTVLTLDEMPVIYREDGISVARIRCEATTKRGERCRRPAEWRQDSDRLVCHTHRFQAVPDNTAPDVEQLRSLLENGTTYTQADGGTLHGEWTRREDWGGDLLVGWGQLADALNWKCGSCRPDVGWAKHDNAVRAFETGEITLHVECGHCGNEYLYNADGEEIP